MGTPGTFNSDQWNSQTFNGPPGSGGGAVATTLGALLSPILRIAGITKRPGIGPNSDQLGELIPAVNRMLASWNCDGHRIFNTLIAAYPCATPQKIYTIGPGANFDAERPMAIRRANIIFPAGITFDEMMGSFDETTGTFDEAGAQTIVRRQIRILDDTQWSSITVQDVPGAPPTYLYYDNSMDKNGWARIYIRPQADTGYYLELYTWQALKANFTAVDDSVILPPGYEEAIVCNGAIRAAALYPLESTLSPDARLNADKALRTLITLNSKCPPQPTEAGYLGHGGGRYNWMSGLCDR